MDLKPLEGRLPIENAIAGMLLPRMAYCPACCCRALSRAYAVFVGAVINRGTHNFQGYS
jgi:hypothetical protein